MQGGQGNQLAAGLQSYLNRATQQRMPQMAQPQGMNMRQMGPSMLPPSALPPGMGGGAADPAGGYGPATMGQSTGGGGVGYQPRMMDTGSMLPPANGLMGNIGQQQAPQQAMPDFGNWLNDYRQREGDGFTGTRGGMNYINGKLYAAEGLSQGTDPNKPDFAFQNILNQYAPQIQQLTGSQMGNGGATNTNGGSNIPRQMPGQMPQGYLKPLQIPGQNGIGRQTLLGNIIRR